MQGRVDLSFSADRHVCSGRDAIYTLLIIKIDVVTIDLSYGKQLVIVRRGASSIGAGGRKKNTRIKV